jgi:hypothetical protein
MEETYQTVPQYTGAIEEGGLHVMLDVGLTDVLGMPAQELKRTIESVNILRDKDGEMTKHMLELQADNSKLTMTVRQLENTNAALGKDVQKLESTVQSLNIREIESVSKFTTELQELRSKVAQLSQEINACLEEFLSQFKDHGKSIEHLGSSKCTVETLENLMKRVKKNIWKLQGLEHTMVALQNSQTQFELNYDKKLKQELDLLKTKFEELENSHEGIVEKYEDLKKSQR